MDRKDQMPAQIAFEAASLARLDSLLKGLNFQSPSAMDQSLITITRAIAACICPGYMAEATSLARAIREYIEFLEQELGKGC